ncbi:bifunctional UDP-2,4-diacetamido-2,4,6-trideoxy-beta-L-altropyranose hydrolase/GNAT family N-acetyltransferase [Cellulomonas triticagri]|uniref:GNAT family N-acetyltransferase n=1 Tax=Cellulomonas triticagri TaxID=2483352 RepID=A0A3M2JRF2_9CELL|nr:bifunctional UDP-2,4-diacetamido-2,4,6-trideoxy-beta-L-altropyranose hydrolase/GNAT family N-acetyltransferase [Cellulomonas triticagri]RMI13275.1 GNAT family N-acetyltransferase [Cellulomonas triticagri]
MRVLLRCDASAGSGVGHLVRSLALAEAARDRGWPVALLGSVDAPLGRRLVHAAGLPVLPAGPLDAAAVARLDADVLHVDHYGVDGDLRGHGPLVSSMEDGTFGRRAADVVVDSTLGAETEDRPDDGSGTVLRGVAYAPLRAAVRAARRLARDPAGADDSPSDVLVVMGGTDAFGVGAAAARLADRAGAPRIRVVAAGEAAERVRALVPTAEVLGPQDDLPALAATAGVVLSAAGTSVWELACVGAPTALVAVTENQRTGYERAVAAGIAVGLGPLDAVRAADPAAVAALAGLLTDPRRRADLRTTGRALVDGLGADRVLDAWWAAGGRPVVAARPARATDGPLLLAWRNDPATRTSSRTQDVVPEDAHLRWLDGVLTDPDRVLLVVERTGSPVGTVRFDRERDDLWEVSITLAPTARGRGLAADVLAAGEQAWRERVGPGPAVLACVRPGNAASVRLFEAAGYRPAGIAGDGLDTFVRDGA